MAKLYDVTFN